MSVRYLSTEEILECPCCMSTSSETFTDPYELRISCLTSKSKTAYILRHNPIFCYDCGHIWNFSSANELSLAEYYRDSLEHFAEAYDTGKRIDLLNLFLEPYITEPTKILDFGSNIKRDFHSQLEGQGHEVYLFDIANDDNASLDQKFDIITCYFVLEHLVRPSEAVQLFKACSKLGSKLIIEVPGAEHYETDYSGLLAVHMQHFQMASLENLCSRYGFKYISAGQEDCSRKFGFVMVFEHTNEIVQLQLKITDTKKSFQVGRGKQLYAEDNYSKHFISEHSLCNFKTIVIWGVNANYENLRSFLSCDHQTILVIDLNRKKKSYVLNEDLFLEPMELLENKNCYLGESKKWGKDVVFIITASAHENSIRPFISEFQNVHLYDPTLV